MPPAHFNLPLNWFTFLWWLGSIKVGGKEPPTRCVPAQVTLTAHIHWDIKLPAWVSGIRERHLSFCHSATHTQWRIMVNSLWRLVSLVLSAAPHYPSTKQTSIMNHMSENIKKQHKTFHWSHILRSIWFPSNVLIVRQRRDLGMLK